MTSLKSSRGPQVACFAAASLSSSEPSSLSKHEFLASNLSRFLRLLEFRDVAVDGAAGPGSAGFDSMSWGGYGVKAVLNWIPGSRDAGGKGLLIRDPEVLRAGFGEVVMSFLLAPAATPVAGEGQLKVNQNGGSEPQVPQLEMDFVVNTSNPGYLVPKDTSSIPGVSMYARQWYPSTFFRHEELVVNKEIFFEALNKFHSVLGTRLTYERREERAKKGLLR